MLWSYVEEHWLAMVPQILARWRDMDEEELEEIDGDREAFLEYLARTESIGPEDADEELAEFLEGAEEDESLDFEDDDDD